MVGHAFLRVIGPPGPIILLGWVHALSMYFSPAEKTVGHGPMYRLRACTYPEPIGGRNAAATFGIRCFCGTIGGRMNRAGRILILCGVWAFFAPAAAFAWKVTNQIDRPNETHYVIKCDNGAMVTVKQMRPVDPKLGYMNNWWLVVGGSYFNYPSQEAAVKAACAAAQNPR